MNGKYPIVQKQVQIRKSANTGDFKVIPFFFLFYPKTVESTGLNLNICIFQGTNNLLGLHIKVTFDAWMINMMKLAEDAAAANVSLSHFLFPLSFYFSFRSN